MRRDDNRIQFRVGDQMFAFLARRAGQHDLSSPDIQAKTDIGTLQALTTAELRRVTLSVGEAVFLADLVDGRNPVPGTAMLYVECRHALGDTGPDTAGLSHRNHQGIDGVVLLAKLERLGPAADFMLCEALAGWRARNLEPTAEGFAQAGLRISPAAIGGHPAQARAGATAA